MSPAITDAQLRAYLLSTGWAEHEDHPHLWEQEDATGLWGLDIGSPSAAVAVLSDFEQRSSADIVRDIGRTMPMAQRGVA
jgi:hypothetical protein